MRIGLIACCKTKLDHAAPAQDLYCSDLFKLSKNWITKPGRCDEWAILSAKHGLVMPDQVIGPYDLALTDMSRDKYKRWQGHVYEQLLEIWGQNAIYMVLAGYEYRTAVSDMPLVEDVIACWTQWRIDRGMTRRRAAVGIGVLKKLLKADTGYY